MTITPQEIQNKEFREAFRGYNQAEVDLFLDEIMEDFGRLFHENQRLRIQIATLQQEAASRPGGGGPLPSVTNVVASGSAAAPPRPEDRAEAREEMKRALVATQRAAEAALEEAKRRAAEIVARAEQRAKEIDELTARRAKDVDSDAGTALTHAAQRVEELKRQEHEIRGRLRRMLAEHVRVLQQLEADPAAAQAAVARAAEAQPQPRPPADPPVADAEPAPPPRAAEQPPAEAPPQAAAGGGGRARGIGPATAAGAKPNPQWLNRKPSAKAASRGDDPAPTIRLDPVPQPAPAKQTGSQTSRKAVVDRMTRELGEAATPPDPPSQRAQAAPRESFWRR